MSSRFVVFADRFEIRCKKCSSTKVTLSTEDCYDCGLIINAICDTCGNKFDYHNFEQIEDFEPTVGTKVTELKQLNRE